MQSSKFNSRVLAEIVMMAGLSATLSYIKIWEMPQGGSITLGAMVPLVVLALRRGPTAGLFGGFISGIIQMFFGGYIFTPIQALLDYPVAFGVIGVAGLFKNRPYIGTTVGIFLRFLAHFISGVVFFGQWAPPQWGPYLYSIIYNAQYLVPELVISGIMVYFLLKRDVLTQFL